MYFTPSEQFLKRNSEVSFTSGKPTWNHWEMVDEKWVVTRYEIDVTLTKIGA